jgi:hypothetical protein
MLQVDTEIHKIPYEVTCRVFIFLLRENHGEQAGLL